jgi:hypothetical protein
MKLRQYVGMLLFEVPRFLWCMRPRWFFGEAHAWIKVRNRNERLISESDQIGVRCDWRWTSNLSIVDRFPAFGRWLMQRAFADFPIVLRNDLEESEGRTSPDVSFLIGHRGVERLPLLLMTLKSIAGQAGCRVECVVVEQDTESRIESHLPEWVRHELVPPDRPDIPFSRSRAFNAAAKLARAQCLIFHDGDLVVPRDYAARVLEFHKSGFEVINLKRIIFYLCERDTVSSLNERCIVVRETLEAAMQNAEGGGSVGMDRDAYSAIGGFDDGFVGWGGEDNEMWERAQTRKVYPYGYLPILHLWHEAQMERAKCQMNGVDRYMEVSNIPPSERIASLLSASKTTSGR